MHKTLQQLHIPRKIKAILKNNTCCENDIAYFLAKVIVMGLCGVILKP